MVVKEVSDKCSNVRNHFPSGYDTDPGSRRYTRGRGGANESSQAALGLEFGPHCDHLLPAKQTTPNAARKRKSIPFVTDRSLPVTCAVASLAAISAS
jgi:hypothetical protein